MKMLRGAGQVRDADAGYAQRVGEPLLFQFHHPPALAVAIGFVISHFLQIEPKVWIVARFAPDIFKLCQALKF